MPDMKDINDLRDLTQECANLARDAAYVVVGLGVLGVQKMQVGKVELQKRLNSDVKVDQAFEGVVNGLTRQVHHLDDIVERAVRVVETSLAPLEDQLPGPARDLAKKAHAQAREVHAQIRERVIPAA
jgi:hypothetical protein